MTKTKKIYTPEEVEKLNRERKEREAQRDADEERNRARKDAAITAAKIRPVFMAATAYDAFGAALDSKIAELMESLRYDDCHSLMVWATELEAIIKARP